MTTHHVKTRKRKEERNIMDPDAFTFLRVNHDLIKINLNDISHASAVSSYASVHVGKKKYLLAITLEKLLLKLPYNDFVRIHRTHAVRIDKIDKIKNNICFVGRKKLPISRRIRSEVMQRLIIIESSKP